MFLFPWKYIVRYVVKVLLPDVPLDILNSKVHCSFYSPQIFLLQQIRMGKCKRSRDFCVVPAVFIHLADVTNNTFIINFY